MRSRISAAWSLIRRWWSALDVPARAGIMIGTTLVLATIIADIWFDVDYRLAANIALLALAGMVNVFTLLYSFRSPWWTHRLGRIYWFKCVVLSLVLDQIALSLWWDLDYPGRHMIRFGIYGMGAVVYVPMVISLLREQAKKLTPLPAILPEGMVAIDAMELVELQAAAARGGGR